MIAIIIVNHKTPELCLAAVHSVLRSKYEEWFICLADNSEDQGASLNKITKKFLQSNIPYALVSNEAEFKIDRKKIFIVDTPNKGFAHANNYYLSSLIQKNGWDFAFLLNSDAEILPETLGAIAKYFEENINLGLCGCKLLDYDRPNNIQCVGGSYNDFTGNLKLVMKDHQDTTIEKSHHAIDYPAGAAMVIRKATLQEVGLLWEDLFLYGEELYWAYLLRSSKWTIDYCFEAKVLHHGGQSINGKEKKTSLLSDYYWLRNRLLLAKRFTPIKYYSMLICSLLYPINRIIKKQYNRVRMYFYVLLNLKNHYSDYIQQR